MMRVAVLLFLLATFHVSTCTIDEGSGNSNGQCIEKEREALLSFKQGLVDPHNLLSSWTNTSGDCCTWRGIKCDNLTHHIIIVDLHDNFKCFNNIGFRVSCSMGSEIGPSLVELQHLRHPDLSFNNFTKLPKFIGSLTRLRYLNLEYNPIVGIIPFQLGNLTRLHFLSLDIAANGHMIANNLEWLSYLPSLKIFQLSFTDLTKATNWFQSIKTAHSLSSLEFRYCHFPQVDIFSLSHKNSSNSLVEFYMGRNTIHPTTVPWLFNLSSNLVNFILGGSQIKGPVPNSFENMRFLASIELWKNEFEGILPKSLGNLCELQELSLYSNKFNITLRDILESLSGCAKDSLEILDLGSNQLVGSSLDLKTTPIFLRELRIGGNQLKGPFPDLSQMSFLSVLDLSSNNFTGIVSEVHFQKLSKLKELYLSSNSLTVNFSSAWIPPFQLDSLGLSYCKLGPQFPSWLKTQVTISYIDISNNRMQDTIPTWFCNLTSEMIILDLSSNQFHGPIQPCLSNVMHLYLKNNKFTSFRSFLCEPVRWVTKLLDLSNNLLFESLPDCWWNLKGLIVLKLDKNKLSGVIPKSIGLLYGIQILDLRRNNFSGNLPLSLKNCQQLQVFDVGENILEGKIPIWIGERLANLVILGLKSNKFYGSIPSNLCHLRSIKVLDLSMNSISGVIPSCIENFTT